MCQRRIFASLKGAITTDMVSEEGVEFEGAMASALEETLVELMTEFGDEKGPLIERDELDVMMK